MASVPSPGNSGSSMSSAAFRAVSEVERVQPPSDPTTPPLKGILRRRSSEAEGSGEGSASARKSCQWQEATLERILKGRAPDVSRGSWEVTTHVEELAGLLTRIQNAVVGPCSSDEICLSETPVIIALAMVLGQSAYKRDFWIPLQDQIVMVLCEERTTESEKAVLWDQLSPPLLEGLNRFRQFVHRASQVWGREGANDWEKDRKAFFAGLLPLEHLPEGVDLTPMELEVADWLRGEGAPRSDSSRESPELGRLKNAAPDRLQSEILDIVWRLEPAQQAHQRVVALTIGLAQTQANLGDATGALQTLQALLSLYLSDAESSTAGVAAPSPQWLLEKSAEIVLDLVEKLQEDGSWLQAQALLMRLHSWPMPASASADQVDLWRLIQHLPAGDLSADQQNRWEGLMAAQVGPLQLVHAIPRGEHYGVGWAVPWAHPIVLTNIRALLATPMPPETRSALFERAFRSITDAQRASMLDHVERAPHSLELLRSPTASSDLQKIGALKEQLKELSRSLLREKIELLQGEWERTAWPRLAPHLHQLFRQVNDAIFTKQKESAGTIWHRATAWIEAARRVARVEGEVGHLPALLTAALPLLFPPYMGIPRGKEAMRFVEVQMAAELCPTSLDLTFNGPLVTQQAALEALFSGLEPLTMRRGGETSGSGRELLVGRPALRGEIEELQSRWEDCLEPLQEAVKAWRAWTVEMRRCLMTGLTGALRVERYKAKACIEIATQAVEWALQSLRDQVNETSSREPFKMHMGSLLEHLTQMQELLSSLTQDFESGRSGEIGREMRALTAEWRGFFFEFTLVQKGTGPLRALSLLCPPGEELSLGLIGPLEAAQLFRKWIEHCLPDGEGIQDPDLQEYGVCVLRKVLQHRPIEVPESDYHRSGVVRLFMEVDLCSQEYAPTIIGAISSQMSRHVAAFSDAKLSRAHALAELEQQTVALTDVMPAAQELGLSEAQAASFAQAQAAGARARGERLMHEAEVNWQRADLLFRERLTQMIQDFFGYRGLLPEPLQKELNRALAETFFRRSVQEAVRGFIESSEGSGRFAGCPTLEEFDSIVAEQRLDQGSPNLPEMAACLSELLDGDVAVPATARIAEPMVKALLEQHRVDRMATGESAFSANPQLIRRGMVFCVQAKINEALDLLDELDEARSEVAREPLRQRIMQASEAVIEQILRYWNDLPMNSDEELPAVQYEMVRMLQDANFFDERLIDEIDDVLECRVRATVVPGAPPSALMDSADQRDFQEILDMHFSVR